MVVKEELTYHLITPALPDTAIAEVESRPSTFPGVRIQERAARTYPAGSMAAHLIHDGVEKSHESTLKGQAGEERIIRNRRGPLTAERVNPVSDGQDIKMTIDSRLQQAAERLLDTALAGHAVTAEAGDNLLPDGPLAKGLPVGGCLVAIDVRTGAVLAAAAAPRDNLALYESHRASNDDDEEEALDKTAEWQRLQNDPRKPFFHRVTEMTVPPGSVFKVLTSVALLESGILGPDDVISCQGYLDRPDRNRCYVYRHQGVGHGDMTIRDALCQSCNVFFFTAARELGPEPIYEWAAKFGFGQKSGADLPGEKPGRLPSPADRNRPWYPGTTLQFAIGQADLSVTPLQVARMMAAIANGGRLVTPHFTQPTRRGDSIQLVSAAQTFPSEKIAGLSPRTLQIIRGGLEQVVASQRGTGKLARHTAVTIAGKTGTAEVGGGKPDHAWFAGYAPADNPRIAFAIVLENGGSGGKVAAPLAKEFVEAAVRTGCLRTTVDSDRPR